MENLNSTPMASRFIIGLFGRRNTGKSSLINALTGQSIALTSDVPGTTTDPVYKAMELLPIGPVAFIDTAGLDDTGELGRLRVEKSYEALQKCNFVIVVADANVGITEFETDFIRQLENRKIPSICVLNKCDESAPSADELENLARLIKIPVVCASTKTGFGIEEVKKQIIENSKYAESEPSLVGDLVRPGDIAVLVTPIDKAAPKGRLILPQQQTIRDIIDKNAVAVVTKETGLKLTLKSLKNPPAIVICDSQAFRKVSEETPEDIPMTSFSILFSRQKGDLAEMVRGIQRIKQLSAGDRVLIVEGCTHHRQEGDIGTVKLPNWIRSVAGKDIEFTWASGTSYPKNLTDFSVIVHCGGCMLGRRQMQSRIETARENGVFMTNYGVLIAYILGILPRALKPFPEALQAFEEMEAELNLEQKELPA